MTSRSSPSDSTSDERALRNKGYILGRKLGEGSYAKVRSCEYVADGKTETLACKIVDRSRAPSDFLDRFFPRELEIMTALDHPNVIRVHSILERQEKVFIFMQHAENGDLLEYIKARGVIKEQLAKIWFRQLHSGLSYLHAKDVAHRDLKCENILLTRNWNVKLADFGFARSVVDENGKRTLSDTYCGSAAYAAPEVIRGAPYNPKMADVWSLGVVLFISVNAAMPFDDSNLKRMLKDQNDRNYSFRSRIRDEPSPQLKALIGRILEPDVTRRFTMDRISRHDWFSSADADAHAMASAHPTYDPASRALQSPVLFEGGGGQSPKVGGHRVPLLPKDSRLSLEPGTKAKMEKRHEDDLSG
ncbi:unnamed protein product [Darwinula stevensoni]|uniref:Protein kinase domain-containing protein n=1 Tax=Darwinula stevensoni TaxID=69355 RepID=A0A7R8ZY64_9CRUS|nr:unnamed protein product [Darwinula stevensoni]CAG0879814.1 unnamed protein product [Darwinula stevensoni]